MTVRQVCDIFNNYSLSLIRKMDRACQNGDWNRQFYVSFAGTVYTCMKTYPDGKTEQRDLKGL